MTGFQTSLGVDHQPRFWKKYFNGGIKAPVDAGSFEICLRATATDKMKLQNIFGRTYLHTLVALIDWLCARIRRRGKVFDTCSQSWISPLSLLRTTDLIFNFQPLESALINHITIKSTSAPCPKFEGEWQLFRHSPCLIERHEWKWKVRFQYDCFPLWLIF